MARLLARLILPALLLLLTQAARAAPGDPVTLAAGAQEAPVDGHFEALIDTTGTATIADVSRGALAFNFEPIAGAVNFGFTAQAIWVRWRVSRADDAPARWILDLTPAFLDDVRVYVPRPSAGDGDGGYSEIVLGRSHPLPTRPIAHNDFLVPLTPPAGTQTYYVRLASTSSLLLHAALRTPAAMISRDAVVDLGFGVFYGVIASIVILNLLYWMMLRARVFLSCALFGATTAITYFSIDGFTALVWFPDSPRLVTLLVSGGVFFNVITASLVFYDALDLRRTMPLAARLFEAIMVLGLVAVAITAAGHYREIAPIGQMMMVAFTAVSLFISARIGMRGIATGWLLFGATIVTLAGLTLSVLRTIGLLPTTPLTDFAFPLAFAVYIIAVDLAVALRVKVAEAARAEAQRQLVDASQAAESRAIRLVDQRTRALAQAKARAERALHEERQVMTQQIRLADMLSHEYRTPLSTIRGNLDILRMIGTEDRTASAALHRMETAVERLTDVIELGLRDGGGALGARPMPRDLRATLAEAVDAALDAHGDRKVEVRLPDEPVSAAIDNRLLRIAIANVIDNALKYSDPGSPVEVELRVERDEAVIRVTDQGVGIPRDEIAHVFTRHYRSSRSTGRQGSGIGLHLSERVVDAHGGQISIESEVGAGTTVTLLLPLADTAPAAPEPSHGEA